METRTHYGRSGGGTGFGDNKTGHNTGEMTEKWKGDTGISGNLVKYGEGTNSEMIEERSESFWGLSCKSGTVGPYSRNPRKMTKEDGPYEKEVLECTHLGRVVSPETSLE